MYFAEEGELVRLSTQCELLHKKKDTTLDFQKETKMREYPKEYKIESVKLYLANGKKKNKTARDLGIPQTTLRGWIKNI